MNFRNNTGPVRNKNRFFALDLARSVLFHWLAKNFVKLGAGRSCVETRHLQHVVFTHRPSRHVFINLFANITLNLARIAINVSYKH